MQDDKNNEAQQPMLSSNDKKVIQSSEGIIQEMQAQQAAQPAPPVPQAPVSQLQPQVPSEPTGVPSPTTQSTIPVGMSASQLGLDSPATTFNWNGLFKKVVVTVVILAGLVGGYMLLMSGLSGMTTKTLNNGGYSYSISFYKAANLVKLNDSSQAYKYLSNIVAGAKPTSANPPTLCADIGSKWQEAFTVQVAGTTRLVCTPDNQDYSMFFTAAGHNQLLTVVYSKPQTSAVYPDLQKIFSSIQVSR